MQQDNKIKAAISGVLHYINTEKERKYEASKINMGMISPWQLNGRQTIMQMRSLMQRRVLKRI